MCIMAYISDGGVLRSDRANEMAMSNSDGFGYMRLRRGRVEIVKYVRTSLFAIDICGVCCVHFRTASSSGINSSCCHPFYVHDDLAFMMNGNLFEFQSFFNGQGDNGETDAQRFNNQVLKKLPVNFLRIPKIRYALESYLRKNFTKVIFLDASGNIDIINEDLGEWTDGVWYSNKGVSHYTGYGYSGAYYYNPGDIRHPGGVISPLFLSKSRRHKYERCSFCKGFFRSIEDKICENCRSLSILRGYCIGL